MLKWKSMNCSQWFRRYVWIIPVCGISSPILAAWSARKMYTLIDPVFLGRDKFEELCFSNGYRLERKKSYQRTTNSLGVTRFENHLSTKKLTGINQAFVSDITYYRIEEKFYYLTFIMDLFSRQILGYSASSNLLTENTTIPALNSP